MSDESEMAADQGKMRLWRRNEHQRGRHIESFGEGWQAEIVKFFTSGGCARYFLRGRPAVGGWRRLVFGGRAVSESFAQAGKRDFSNFQPHANANGCVGRASFGGRLAVHR